jgi:hypothetical protein
MIEVKSIKVYYMNPDTFTQRRSKMDELLTKLGFQFERIPSNSSHELRQTRMCEGYIKLAETAIGRGCFPFLILDDDATPIEELPASISIPVDSRFIYLGASTWECGGIKKPLVLTEYNDFYYRVKHSLSSHAILVPTKESAEHFIKVIKTAIEKSEFNDIILAIDSEEEIYLTPKDGPYFYQNDAHTEPITKFKWKDLINEGSIIIKPKS